MNVLALGLDYAYRVPPATLAEVRRAGVSFVCRYIAPETMKKTLTADEAREIDAAGLNIVSVWETTARRALQGAPAGEADARTALAVARAAGQPPGTPIYFAVDTDVRLDADLLSVESYLRAAGRALAGQYPVGVYGSALVVEAMIDRKAALYAWQTAAWSHGRVSPVADLYQAQNGVNWCGFPNDLDYALQEDFGQWRPGGAPYALQPLPEGRVVVDPDSVRKLQQLLNALGANPPLVVDGIFGPKTRAALMAAQAPNLADADLGRRLRELLTAAQKQA
ncbi:MAG: DUF1906 domain-containing protein [Bacillota bacterium]|nr:DUF1906 domain-containing protein [Bacillota bacterium]